MIKKFFWTEKENKVIMDNYESCDVKTLQKSYLPNYTVKSIYDQIYRLGLKKVINWSDSEIEALKNNYHLPTEKIKELFIPERTKAAIQAKIIDLRLRDTDFWTEEEIDILINNYPTCEWKELKLLLPKRTESSINHMAERLKIGRSTRIGIKYKVERLLEETPEAYYWMGVLLADGHFVKDKTALQIGVSDNDEDWIIKFENFIGEVRHTNLKTGKTAYTFVRYHDKHVVTQLMEKFDINNRKTYFPPNLEKIHDLLRNNDLFISLFVGFIDGDGHITKNGKELRITNHGSWLSILTLFKNRLSEIFPCLINCKINSRGYANFDLYSWEILRKIKNKAHQLKLPILKRKWNKILR